MTARHHFEEHTGEVRLRLEADSLPALFAEAGRGLAELQAGDAAVGEFGPEEPVAVRGKDLADLLVAWIDELVYRSEVNKRVYTRFRIEAADERVLRGAIQGGAPEHLKTQVKAATFHGLELLHAGGCWKASIVLDV